MLSRFILPARHTLLDALFPPRCAGCGEWQISAEWRHDPFCAHCTQQIALAAPPLCERCGAPSTVPTTRCVECHDLSWPPALKMVRAPGIYEGPLRDGIHRFKYRGLWSLAEGLGARLHRWCGAQPLGAERLPIERVSLIVPVPLHPWRQWRRGYNQSALLAAQLGAHLHVPSADLLQRTRYTPPQVSLSGQERASNVRQAFALNQKRAGEYRSVLRSGAVLLLDDVITTGATLRECARCLQEAGATEIYAVALARALA